MLHPQSFSGRLWSIVSQGDTKKEKELCGVSFEDKGIGLCPKTWSTSPGTIGTINATALAAAVGNARAFGRGREMAAWLGLTPRQMTTGGKPRLLGISKRGNRYLRKNLIHGAR